MIKIAAGAVVSLLLFSGQAMALCTSYTTLTNGTLADATVVNSNFNCAALTSGATLNATTLTGTPTIVSPATGTDVMDLNNHSAALGVEFREDAGSFLKQYMYDHTGTSANVFFQGEGGSYFLQGLTVGTTAGGGWNGNAEFESHIGTSGYALSGYTVYTGGSGGGALLLRVDTTAVDFANLIYSGSAVGSITTNGTSTSYNTTSDARLKQVDKQQHNYRDTIEHLWVGDFHWKSNGTQGFGIVAQQAYPLFPEAITKPSNDNGIWEADYGKFAPLALWGVKDVYKITATQKKKVEALERTVSDLKRANDNETAEIQALKAQMAAMARKFQVQTAQR